MADGPTDTQILAGIFDTLTAQQMATLVDQMQAGANPYGFALPGVAIKQLIARIQDNNRLLGPSHFVPIPAPPAVTQSGTPVAIAGGIAGVPIVAASPYRPDSAGNLQSPGNGPDWSRQQPSTGPTGAAIGVPQAPPPHQRRTPTGPTPDQVIVDMVNDP